MTERVRIRHVGADHYVVSGGELRYGWTDIVEPSSRLPRNAREFWSRCGDLPLASDAFVATCDGELVGFFRYTLVRLGRGRLNLNAEGTWVSPSHRRRGLATRMWRAALRRHRIRLINVVTASRMGHGLVRSLDRAGVRVEEFASYS